MGADPIAYAIAHVSALEGDVIDGQTVSDFYLYDPVSPSGDIVVMASTGSNDALLRFSLLE